MRQMREENERGLGTGRIYKNSRQLGLTGWQIQLNGLGSWLG